jgi:hypothetical protein
MNSNLDTFYEYAQAEFQRAQKMEALNADVSQYVTRMRIAAL